MPQQPSTITEFQKSQTVRLLDIFVLAPFLVYAGARKSDIPEWIRIGLVGTGIATFLYNADNYIKNLKK